MPHDAGGVVTLGERLQTLPPPLLVLEASGGLKRGAPAALAPTGRPGGVGPPRQARDWARATGPFAKPEALEARARAHCAAVIRPTPRPLPDAQTQARRALLGRRQPRIGLRGLRGLSPFALSFLSSVFSHYCCFVVPLPNFPEPVKQAPADPADPARYVGLAW